MSKSDEKELKIEEKNIEKETEKKLKIKGYDLISFYNVETIEKEEIYKVNIPMNLTYKKYKVVRIENEEKKEEIKVEN